MKVMLRDFDFGATTLTFAFINFFSHPLAPGLDRLDGGRVSRGNSVTRASRRDPSCPVIISRSIREIFEIKHYTPSSRRSHRSLIKVVTLSGCILREFMNE